jgi:hypothetical protein
MTDHPMGRTSIASIGLGIVFMIFIIEIEFMVLVLVAALK